MIYSLCDAIGVATPVIRNSSRGSNSGHLINSEIFIFSYIVYVPIYFVLARFHLYNFYNGARLDQRST